MAYGTRGKFDTVREIAFGAISGTYAAVGAAFADNVRILGLNNSTDQEIYVSLDGVNNNLRMAANSFQLYDLTANRVRDDGLFFAVGDRVFVKEVSAAVGSGAFWVHALAAAGGK